MAGLRRQRRTFCLRGADAGDTGQHSGFADARVNILLSQRLLGASPSARDWGTGSNSSQHPSRLVRVVHDRLEVISTLNAATGCSGGTRP